MKLLGQILEIIKEDVSATRSSIKKSIPKTRSHFATLSYILSSPLNVFYGVVLALMSIAVAVWLANVQIIQQLFASHSLDLRTQLSFMATMLSTTLSNIELLQLALIAIFGTGSLLLWASWLEALKLQHDNQLIREKVTSLLAASLVAGSLGIIGVSLVTPVITREGLSVFVSQHFSGTLVLALAIIMQLKLLHLFLHRLFAEAEKNRQY